MGYFGRGLNTVQDPYNLSDMYDEYIKTVEPSTPYYITRKQYIDINSFYLQSMADKILAGERTYMNFRLGSFEILKFKRVKTLKYSPIDWKASVEHGKKVYNLNDHSKGHRYQFHWYKRDCKVSNKEHFTFIFSRYNRRGLAKLIKSGKVDYFEKIYYDN